MKKLLGLALALAVAMPASAELLRNFELTGDVQVIASDVRHNINTPADAMNSGTNLRVLAGGSFDLAENVRANLMFQYINVWGEGPTAEIGTIGKSVDDYMNEVRLVEANVEMKEIFGWLDVKAGRQFYGEEDSTVIYFGPRYYNAELNAMGYNNNYASALDAVKFSYADDYWNVNVIAGEMAEGFITPTGDAHGMYGADAKLRMSDALSLQAYMYNFKSFLGYDNFGFYGAKVNFAPEAFVLSAEYARNMAGDRVFKEVGDNPYMLKLDGKINMGDFTPRAAFVYSKGFRALGNYRPGLLVGDYAGVETLAVLGRIYNLGVDYKYDKWIFALDGFAFQDRTAKTNAAYEGDLVVKYDYNDNIQLFAGAGYIKYGDLNIVPESDNVKGQAGVLVRL